MFHRDLMHSAKECQDLKDEIKHLIMRGNLREFVQNGRPKQEYASEQKA